jgi:hypothetical protein
LPCALAGLLILFRLVPGDETFPLGLLGRALRRVSLLAGQLGLAQRYVPLLPDQLHVPQDQGVLLTGQLGVAQRQLPRLASQHGRLAC